MKLMLVDDDPFMLSLLTRQVAELGYSDLEAHESAEAALVALQSEVHSVGLVCCDLQMPRMDGVEFVRHLARLGYRGDLVLISGEDERILRTAERIARAHQLNVLGFLRKPVRVDELRRLLGEKRAPSVSSPKGAGRLYPAEELATAIARKELVNYYQPKVAVGSGDVVGVEALVRWRRPDGSLVVPDDFIPVAEDSGLIEALTREVLFDALKQSRQWRDDGLDLQVSVNVSVVNLAALEFPDFVAGAASFAGVPLSSLVLEVTESRLMKDRLTPLDILTRLRLKHIGVSIDDFGTGHSSLAQLRDIPFDELKVDRGFVHGACRDPSLRAIVEASLAMARQLGMKSVAEGAEDRDDWDYLRAAGCDLAQGHFIATPMPGPALVDWMGSWERRRRDVARRPV